MNLRLLGDVWAIDVAEIQIANMRSGASGLYLANLETPIYPDGASPHPKSGPHQVSNLKILSEFAKAISPVCLSLANNHTMDYGEIGLRKTRDVCNQLGIQTIGAGGNLLEAYTPVIYEISGKQIGIIGCCESQFGAATFRRAGVAAINPMIYSVIHRLACELDTVVVSVHGAAELCPWPSPQWQDTMRSFIDAGARVVHGHHAHVPQGYEAYHGGVIFYGLGNFIVNPSEWYNPNHPHSLWSVMAECSHTNDKISYSIKTAVIEKRNSGVSVQISTDQESQKHSAYLSKCNLPLQNRTLLTGLWQEAAMRMYDLWYSGWLGFHPTRQGNAIKARLSAIKQVFRAAVLRQGTVSREREMLLYHTFSCESHREVISTALGVLCGELDDLRNDEFRCLVDELMPWSISSITEMEWPYKG